MSIVQKMLAVMFAMVLVAGCSSQQSDKDSDGSTDDNSGLSGADGSRGTDDRNGNWGAVSDQYGNVVYFEHDSSDIAASSEEMLNAYASMLKKTKSRATLEGNTDESGTREYNMALGERRGKAVADYLTMQGVSSSQLEVVSFGEERPAVEGTGESAYSKNRRVEIIK